jgi:hypothetical protein
LPEDEIVPRVEEIRFEGKLTGTLAKISEKLSQLPFFEIKEDAGKVLVTRIESRNIHKRPFLFYIVEIAPDSLEIIYSIAPDTSENMRRMVVIKNTMSILAIVSGEFQVEQTKFFQYAESIMNGVINGLSQSYSTMFNSYESLLIEYREMRKINSELVAANRNLTIQATQLDNEARQLREQLSKLQTYSDESIMSMLEDWIDSHSNSIDIDEFSKTYKIAAPRVEQVLDKMISLGYIELKG